MNIIKIDKPIISCKLKSFLFSLYLLNKYNAKNASAVFISDISNDIRILPNEVNAKINCPINIPYRIFLPKYNIEAKAIPSEINITIVTISWLLVYEKLSFPVIKYKNAIIAFIIKILFNINYPFVRKLYNINLS